MRKYKDGTGTIEKIICNKCKRELVCKDDILREGEISLNIEFGYFSRKDGIRHRFDLCEDCYDRIVADFELPVEEEQITEMV